MTALRYIDLVLLWLTVPLALALGAPQLGVLLAGVVWTVQRLVALDVDRRARERASVREAIGLNMATMFARMWLIGATVVVAGVAGEREDGAAAAAVLLVAFTISFVSTLLNRSLTRAAPRPRTPERA
ncbi:MAG: hypothetical protein AVDCRST_MAG67-3770 [uncultured Solirubrobacteraceae bacterium]|uniref:Uncharacterized protein n=1 Tax=uncultured Solirubrobacteraceae bacterium TaxID=1162706 RepID=A0A6J4TPF4_9ACTN|nr:MAG: hypothetical protein AVDCRST_MAG67-3770 [uncultured Solirubrobacteraceae bacterium]